MATALKSTSQQYYFNNEEVKVYNSSNTSKQISDLLKKHNGLDQDLEERKSLNQKINELKVKFFEERISLLEGGVDALAVSSFQEARRLVIKNLALPGDNIITINSASLLFDSSITKEEKIEVRNAYDGKLSTFASFVDSRTKAIYVETIASDYNIPDFIKISTFAKAAGIPLIVDNTAGAIGYVSTPLKNGADLVIVNTSELLKTFDGLIGGAIIDGGSFQWNKDKFTQLSSYINLYQPNYPEKFLFVNYLKHLYTNTNNSVIPATNEILDLINEVEALPFIFQKQSAVALELAKWLNENEHVKSVNYTGLPSNGNYLNALRYFKNGFGNKFTFSLNAYEGTIQHFIYSLQRRKILFNKKSEKGYDVKFNPTNLSIEVVVHSASSKGILEDFIYAFADIFNS